MSTTVALSHALPAFGIECQDATDLVPIDLPRGMYILPRGDDTVDILPVPGTGDAERCIISYRLNDGSVGVPLHRAVTGPCGDIFHASKAICNGDVQKHTLSINIESHALFNKQKYAFNTKGPKRRGKTYAEVAKQVADLVKEFYETHVKVLAREYNKLNLGSPGLRFEDLYLVALVPLTKHKRMYECILGCYTAPAQDATPYIWSSRYQDIFKISFDVSHYNPVDTADTSLGFICPAPRSATSYHGRSARKNMHAPYVHASGVHPRSTIRARKGYRVELTPASTQHPFPEFPSSTAAPLDESYTTPSTSSFATYPASVMQTMSHPIGPTTYASCDTLQPPNVHAFQEADEWPDGAYTPQRVHESESLVEEDRSVDTYSNHATTYDYPQYNNYPQYNMQADTQAYDYDRQDSPTCVPDFPSSSLLHYVLPGSNFDQWNGSASSYVGNEDPSSFAIPPSSRSSSYDESDPAAIDLSLTSLTQQNISLIEQSHMKHEDFADLSYMESYYPTPPVTTSGSLAYTRAFHPGARIQYSPGFKHR